jgi:hypothetical protein
MEVELGELPSPRSEERILLMGIELPSIPPNIEESALTFYEDIQKYLPVSLLSIISASNLEEALLKWQFLAILANKKMITFKSGTTKERKGETYAFFEDVEVVPLST